MSGTHSRPGFFVRLLHWFNNLRLFVVNFVFFIVILLVIAVLSQEAGVTRVPPRAALVVDPAGMLVEQLSYTDPMGELLRVTGNNDERHELLLTDLIDSISLAAKDPRIKVLVLRLDGLYGTGLTKLNEVGRAVDEFKKSGKPVIAYGDYFDQNQYALASYADEIYVNPMGTVEIYGYGVYDNFFKEALDKLLIDYHVFRAGKFKSAVEPFLRNDMSEQAKSNHLAWLNVLWQQYTELVSRHRDIEVDKLNDLVARQDQYLQENGGDSALMVLAKGLVDGLKAREEMNAYLIDLVGAQDENGDFERVYFDEYLHLEQLRHAAELNTDNVIGVVVAQGEIMDGVQMPGMVGGDSLADLIRTARDDEKVRAVVLRIDSPGGSVFASEIIRQALRDLQQSGKPLVVSMSSLAASGGYWIAADADEIWASPSTLTGSIGVYGALPTISRSLDKLGVHSDGVGTTPMADSYSLDRPLNPLMKNVIQQSVDFSYQRFLKVVGDGRDMKTDAVDAIAQGQVWTGEQAKALGLVDQLGYREQAVAAAARLAKVDKYHVETIEPELTPFERLVLELSQKARLLQPRVEVPASLVQLFRPFIAELAQLQRMSDPRGIYSHCLECSGF